VKKAFTILHTNDLYSAFIGLGPAADYTPRSMTTTHVAGMRARRR
jgi:hypothetical protein